MNSKDYRSYLVECVKTAGNMIINMADDIVGETDAITNLSLEVSFDQENRSITEITITRMHLPDYETLEHLLDIHIEKLKKENKDG
jgi:hypothetical protein